MRDNNLKQNGGITILIEYIIDLYIDKKLLNLLAL